MYYKSVNIVLYNYHNFTSHTVYTYIYIYIYKYCNLSHRIHACFYLTSKVQGIKTVLNIIALNIY